MVCHPSHLKTWLAAAYGSSLRKTVRGLYRVPRPSLPCKEAVIAVISHIQQTQSSLEEAPGELEGVVVIVEQGGVN